MYNRVNYKGQPAREIFGDREEMSMAAEPAVKAIIADIRARGDAALREYALKFDGYDGGELFATDEEIEDAVASLPDEYLDTLRRSIDNISKFHAMQKREGFEIEADGAVVGERVIPLKRVGIYIPGGTAGYPSTVLMNAIPAKIAGVEEVVMATPAKADGNVRKEVLAAAKLCGVDRILKVGGAQAIAALAYGTTSVPKVDKITGPGNIYVATAKKLIGSDICGIDMIAGPSEILVIADEGADPACVAADLISQAEHDILASPIFITDSVQLAKRVCSEIKSQLRVLERKSIAQASIENNCRTVIVPDIDTAINLSNEFAPEHLELCLKDARKYLDKVQNAGSVFLGYNTPEAVGDYYAGANHTLPTGGSARFASPLGVNDFVKVTQYMEYTEEALKRSSKDIIRFAKSEGLTGHAESIAIRTKNE